jgi:LPXTG-motif cell wall-anchored protein
VPGGTIPSTGRDTTPMVLFAGLLLMLGATAIALVRRPGNDHSD